MQRLDRCNARRVLDGAGRERVIDVLRATYEREKRWVADAGAQLPLSDLSRGDVSWFEAVEGDRAVGVVRILYDPPLATYAQYGFTTLDQGSGICEFLARHRIAEVGRFAVLSSRRGQIMPAATLMRAAAVETIRRGYSHLITDVFEDDPHNPYGFHTRVMGFEPVATHARGELLCDSRRLTLVLDLRAAYARLRRRGNWFYRYLTEPWDEALHRQLAA